jgi:hypothetical protein
MLESGFDLTPSFPDSCDKYSEVDAHYAPMPMIAIGFIAWKSTVAKRQSKRTVEQIRHFNYWKGGQNEMWLG